MNQVKQWVTHSVEFVADWLMAWRKGLLALFVLLSLGLGYSALNTQLDPGFNKQIPVRHAYMVNFLKFSQYFTGANRLLVSVRWKGEGDIYNPEFLETLRKVTDDVFFISGVSRPSVTSLFTANVRYIEITEEGFYGDVVVPPRFSGSPDDLAQVRSNAAASGQVGRLIANDLKSAMVRADLQDLDPRSGKPVDYTQVANSLEEIRQKYASDTIEINVVGFAKLVGDVVEGLTTVIGFFAIAFVITGLLLWLYSRSLRLTVVALVVALLPVVWLLGLLPLLGLGIDPMSILVPFLIFSIGVSHAVQMTNAWKQDVVAGATSLQAARTAFCKIFIPGSLALLMNALGFGVIMLIDIPIVHELGVTACIGVMLMIITNKLMLPIIISWLPLERGLLSREQASRQARHRLWWRLSALAEPGPALAVFGLSLLLLAAGAWKARDLAVGDIGAGAPELRADSRYNQDNARIISSYSIGLDVLAVFVQTHGVEEGCLNPEVMRAVEGFDFRMRAVQGVQSVQSVAGMGKRVIAGNNEGNPRWAAIPGSSRGLSQGARAYMPDDGLVTDGCQQMQILVFLADHEGATVSHAVNEAKRIIAEVATPRVEFLLAGGNVGVMAASNEAVKRAEVIMLAALFGSVALFCWLTFLSVRAVLCILVPLAIVAILCNALMAMLGIGLKVATLPVMALGVGVGVDYGIYLYERIQHEMSAGADLREAFYQAMCQRGTAAVFTALTMSIGVCTWAFAPLKFQADMGVLLSFMFLVNVLGAIFLLPALAAWFNRGRPLVAREAQSVEVVRGEFRLKKQPAAPHIR
ncbi:MULTISPECIES: efflux RND transporter permease subunit [unclassified Pseudomonas]|uniref:efflux RND transporter permease subunit n=1 Tax=unclassified Pseudomonas TaxID=196821 RepID=UPI000BA2F8A0|nr:MULTISPECIES: efflux RND transporter permease subunit [unclassified Pseudomonas]MCU1722776.1 efflux RND transporter permease subunit [Pseudomonas sp. 5P_5.1_Bac1]MCU1733011.1 efflux RND transporter permease subunit [Pseudomonas sp. 20P_3.2_Bac4]MCU1744112.1 efflux RND transporter permease subunit [Pseudomonas sp. 20P_3.2_Bac5]